MTYQLTSLGRDGYVPFFPWRVQSVTVVEARSSSNVTQATPIRWLAWLLRSPNILLIPGTSSLEHLRENSEAATLQLPPDHLSLTRLAEDPL